MHKEGRKGGKKEGSKGRRKGGRKDGEGITGEGSGEEEASY